MSEKFKNGIGGKGKNLDELGKLAVKKFDPDKQPKGGVREANLKESPVKNDDLPEEVSSTLSTNNVGERITNRSIAGEMLNRTNFVSKSGALHDDKVQFLKNGFKNTSEVRDPDFNVKKAKQAVISSARNAYYLETKRKGQDKKDIERDRESFSEEDLYYKEYLNKDSDFVRGVDSETEKIVNSIPEENLDYQSIDAEATKEEAEELGEQVFNAQLAYDKDRTVDERSVVVTKEGSLSASFDSESFVRDSFNNAIEGFPPKATEKAAAELEKLVEEKGGYEKLSRIEAEEMIEKTVLVAEGASSMLGGENMAALDKEYNKENIVAPQLGSETDMETLQAEIDRINSNPDNAPPSYIDVKKKEKLAENKRLKDYKKAEVIKTFREGSYPLMLRAINSAFSGEELTKELNAYENWVHYQERDIKEDYSKKIEENYLEYRSPINLGGKQLSEHRVAAEGDMMKLELLEEADKEKRQKIQEAYSKMKQAEKLGDEENRTKFEKDYKKRKKQSGYFTEYSFHKRQEKKKIKRDLALNTWKTQYDETFRPKTAFGFARQKFNMQVYTGLFNMKYWPGYLGVQVLAGFSKGLDWGLTKLKNWAENLKKNKLLDWSKLNGKGFLG